MAHRPIAQPALSLLAPLPGRHPTTHRTRAAPPLRHLSHPHAQSLPLNARTLGIPQRALDHRAQLDGAAHCETRSQTSYQRCNRRGPSAGERGSGGGPGYPQAQPSTSPHPTRVRCRRALYNRGSRAFPQPATTRHAHPPWLLSAFTLGIHTDLPTHTEHCRTTVATAPLCAHPSLPMVRAPTQPSSSAYPHPPTVHPPSPSWSTSHPPLPLRPNWC